MQISRELLRRLRPEIESALAGIGEKHGITLNLGNASFTDYDFTFKLKGAVTNTGDGRPAAAAEWDLYRSRFGLQAVEFGTSFTTRSGDYTVVGIAPKSRKYPVIGASTIDGRKRKFVPEAVLPRAAA
jgi:hypothetical protein